MSRRAPDLTPPTGGGRGEAPAARSVEASLGGLSTAVFTYGAIWSVASGGSPNASLVHQDHCNVWHCFHVWRQRVKDEVYECMGAGRRGGGRCGVTEECEGGISVEESDDVVVVTMKRK